MIMITLKDIFNVLQKDIKSENFSKRECVIYGIVVPLALVAACVLGDFLTKQ